LEKWPTKSAVDAKKVTISRVAKSEPIAEVVAEESVAPENVVQKQQQAVKTAEKFAKQTAEKPEGTPMSAEEMKALIAQAKEAEGDDCLMCGS
jgi:ribonucleoside-diphosphate reductase alpha chain